MAIGSLSAPKIRLETKASAWYLNVRSLLYARRLVAALVRDDVMGATSVRDRARMTLMDERCIYTLVQFCSAFAVGNLSAFAIRRLLDVLRVFDLIVLSKSRRPDCPRRGRDLGAASAVLVSDCCSPDAKRFLVPKRELPPARTP